MSITLQFSKIMVNGGSQSRKNLFIVCKLWKKEKEMNDSVLGVELDKREIFHEVPFHTFPESCDRITFQITRL